MRAARAAERQAMELRLVLPLQLAFQSAAAHAPAGGARSHARVAIATRHAGEASCRGIQRLCCCTTGKCWQMAQQPDL